MVSAALTAASHVRSFSNHSASTGNTKGKGHTVTLSESPQASNYTLQLSSEHLTSIEGVETGLLTTTTDLSYGKWAWCVRTIETAGAELHSESFEPATMPPGDAPPVEIPPAMILFVMFVSIASIVFIVLEGLRRQNGRKGQETSVEFTRQLNTRTVAITMILLGTLTPCLMAYRIYTDPVTSDVQFQLNLVALLWSLWFEVDFWRFDLPSLPVLAYSLVLLAFYLIYVYEVIEYCQGRASWTKTILAWLISQMPLLITVILDYASGIFPSSFFYEGPTFITLVAGLIIMKIAGPKPSRAPW